MAYYKITVVGSIAVFFCEFRNLDRCYAANRRDSASHYENKKNKRHQ